MGLYDTVKIAKSQLPKGIEENTGYQTKSLWNDLNEYEINEEGKLFLIEDYNKEEGLEEPIFIDDYIGEIDLYGEKYHLKAWCVNGIVKEVIELPK